MKFTFVILLVNIILCKESQRDLRMWQFHNTDCQYMMRFGTPRQNGHLFFEHDVDWRSDEERQLYGNIRGEVLILDQEGDRVMKDMLAKEEKDALKAVHEENVVGRYIIGLFENRVDHYEFRLKESNKLYYFYFCDYNKEIIQSYQRKLEKYREDAKNSNMAGSQTTSASDSDGTRTIKQTWTGGPTSLSTGTVVKYKITIVDDEMYHHSIEAYNTGRISTVFLVLYLVLFLFVYLKHRKYRQQNETVDHPLFSITSVVGCQLISISFKMASYIIYGNVGYDFGFFDLFHKLMFMLSDGILCYFFLLMSKSWGMKIVHFIDDYELETAFGIVIWLCRYLWIIVGYFTENMHDNMFHMYDGVTGKLEIVNLIGIYIWFVFSMKRSDLSTKEKFKKFGNQLRFLAAVYFCARPLSVVFIYMVDKVHQHELSLIVTLTSHLLASAVLSLILTNKKGVYMNYSMSNGLELTGNTKIS